MHDNFGLRLIFTLSARLQFTLCSALLIFRTLYHHSFRCFVVLYFFSSLSLPLSLVLLLFHPYNVRETLVFHTAFFFMKVILAIYAFRLLFFFSLSLSIRQHFFLATIKIYQKKKKCFVVRFGRQTVWCKLYLNLPAKPGHVNDLNAIFRKVKTPAWKWTKWIIYEIMMIAPKPKNEKNSN